MGEFPPVKWEEEDRAHRQVIKVAIRVKHLAEYRKDTHGSSAVIALILPRFPQPLIKSGLFAWQLFFKQMSSDAEIMSMAEFRGRP